MNLVLKMLRKLRLSQKKYKWIFIVGCYNSGTTLLARILEQHPQIAGLPSEGQFLTDQLVTPVAEGFPRLWVEKEEIFRFDSNEKRDIVQKIKEDWQGNITKPSAEFILEKSPPNTGRMLWLQENFPNSFFIHIVRNGYAVALGIEKKVTDIFGYKKDLLQRAASQWNRSAEIVLEDAKNIDNFLEISYEDLTDISKITVNRITDFLHISPFKKNILNSKYKIHEQNRKIQNLNPERLKNMTIKQKKVIESEADSLLKYYGYKQNEI